MSHKKLSALISVTAATGILSLTAVVQQERKAHEGIRVEWSSDFESASAAVRVEVVVESSDPLELRPASTTPAVVETEARERRGPLDLYYVAECLVDVHTGTELDTARACVSARLGDGFPTSDQLAGWISGLQGGRMAEAELLTAEVLTRLEPSEVLEYVQRLARACLDVLDVPGIGGFRNELPPLDQSITQLLLRSIARGESSDVEWYGEFGRSLEPGGLFRGGDETLALTIAHQFAEHGDDAARRLIEAGATGRHGGSSEELLRAADLGMTLQRDGTESIAFLTSILESGTVPGQMGFGRFMAQKLMEPTSWVAGEPHSAFLLLERVLDDPRFRLGAAEALHKSMDQVPPGVSPAVWEELRTSDAGRVVLDQLAVIIPD